MKILICHTQNFFGTGGSDTASREIAIEFARRGNKVYFVQRAEDWKDTKEKNIFLNNYPKVKMYGPDFISGLYLIYLRRNILKKLKKIKEKEKYFDLILCTSPPTLDLALKVFPNNKIILRLPAIEASELKNTWKNRNLKKKLQGILLKNYESKAIKNSKIIVLNSNLSKKLLKKYYPNHPPAFIIKNGISKNFFKKIRKKRQDIIIVPSRLSVEKNLFSLIKLANYLKKDFKINIFGNGELKKELEEKIIKSNLNKKIFLQDYTKKIKEEYERSKIMLLPSTHESFGLVLIEAMACGLPVIAFKPNKKIITASDEIIENGKTGFLVKDEKEMAEKIDLLLVDKKLWNKMSSNSRQEARRYSWKKYVDELEKI